MSIFIVTRSFMGSCGFEESVDYTFIGDEAYDKASQFYEKCVNAENPNEPGTEDYDYWEPDYYVTLHRGNIKDSMVVVDGDPIQSAQPCLDRERRMEKEA